MYIFFVLSDGWFLLIFVYIIYTYVLVVIYDSFKIHYEMKLRFFIIENWISKSHILQSFRDFI